MKGDSFRRHEVSSIYVHPDERFVVSLIVGYGDEVRYPWEAALAALELTRDGGHAGTRWFVFDRATNRLQSFEQEEFDPELASAELGACQHGTCIRDATDRTADGRAFCRIHIYRYEPEAGPSIEIDEEES
jgi:hypothetical protein